MDWLQTLVSSGVVVALGLLGWRMHSSGRSQDREYTKQLVEVVRTEVGHVRDDVRELRTDFRELRADVADIDKRLVAVETTLMHVHGPAQSSPARSAPPLATSESVS